MAKYVRITKYAFRVFCNTRFTYIAKYVRIAKYAFRVLQNTRVFAIRPRIAKLPWSNAQCLHPLFDFLKPEHAPVAGCPAA
jgi:hypothetical protein